MGFAPRLPWAQLCPPLTGLKHSPCRLSHVRAFLTKLSHQIGSFVWRGIPEKPNFSLEELTLKKIGNKGAFPSSIWCLSAFEAINYPLSMIGKHTGNKVMIRRLRDLPLEPLFMQGFPRFWRNKGSYVESDSPKGKLQARFPDSSLAFLFPDLYPAGS